MDLSEKLEPFGLASNENSTSIADYLWLLPTVHHARLSRHILRQIRLHLAYSNLAVPIDIGITLHPSHQVVAEDAMLEFRATA